MTARQATSYILACNVCGDDLPPQSGEQFSPKFADVRSAVAYTRDEHPDWSVQPDGYAVCGARDESHASVRETLPAPEPVAVDAVAESPSETVERAAMRLHRRASAAIGREQAWLRCTAESWEHLANDMAGHDEVNVSSAPETDAHLLMADRHGYRHDWTATLAAENERLRGQVQAWMRSADNDGLTIKKISQERGRAQDEAARCRTAFESLATAVEAACSFDAGEALPESSPWAAALDRLDTALTEIRDGLKAATR